MASGGCAHLCVFLCEQLWGLSVSVQVKLSQESVAIRPATDEKEKTGQERCTSARCVVLQQASTCSGRRLSVEQM